MTDQEMTELDRLLAAEVMEWEELPNYNYWMTLKDGAVDLHVRLVDWHPTRDIAQAFMVAEKIGLLRLVDCGSYELSDLGERLWDAEFGTARTQSAPSPALAISLAAKAWLERLKREILILKESLRQSDAIKAMPEWEEEDGVKNVVLNGHKTTGASGFLAGYDPMKYQQGQAAFAHLHFHLDSPVEAGWQGVMDVVHARLKQLEDLDREFEQQRTLLRELADALKDMCELHGGWHDDDCSLDDTCDCSHKPFNQKINAALARAEEVLK